MSQQYAWKVLVTDARGHQVATADDTFTNPYISAETAQQVAERIAATVGPRHSDGSPPPQDVTVQVWHRPDATGDPIATAHWSAPAAP
jgi:hypothetical protein